MRIMVCYWGFPLPVRDGQDLRIYEIFKRLSRRHQVFLYSMVDTEISVAENVLKDAERIFKLIKIKKVKRRTIGHLFSGIIPRRSLDIEFPYFKKEVLKDLLSIIKENRVNILYVNGFPASLFTAPISRIPKVLDLSDSRTLIWLRSFKEATKYRHKLICFLKYLRARNIERFLGTSFDAITFVSKEDADFQKKISPTSPIAVIYNGVDANYFAPLEDIEQIPDSMIFFGNMDYPPNIDAVTYFCENIFPRIKSKNPKAKFCIVGRNPVDKVISLRREDILVTGEVDDIRSWIAKCSVTVIPMRTGSGVKNKILESLAMAKPVVTTPISLSGLSSQVIDALSVCNTEKEFSDEVIKLMRNRQMATSKGIKGRTAVQESHTWSHTTAKYEGLFHALLSKGCVHNIKGQF